MFLACLVKPQRLRGVRAAIPVAERDNGGGGQGNLRRDGPCTRFSSLQRTVGQRRKAGGRKQSLRRAIRDVNFNSYREIAGTVSINLQKRLLQNLDLTAERNLHSSRDYTELTEFVRRGPASVEHILGRGCTHVQTMESSVHRSQNGKYQLPSSGCRYQPPCHPPTDLSSRFTLAILVFFVRDTRLSHRSMRNRETDRQADRQTNDV